MGVSHASNKGIKSSTSDYFMRVDADDFLSIRACLILITFLEENPKYPFAYGDIKKILNYGTGTIIKRNNLKNLLEYGAGVMFRTDILKKVKGYNEKLRNCEDYDLIARIIEKFGDGLYLPISYYRYYKTNTSHLTSKKSRKKLKEKLKKKYEYL